ncbi:unnamed protein product, partial [Rotaria sp. Silwood2]
FSRCSVESDRYSLFGVDWSNKVHPRSHCWLPYCLIDCSRILRCAYTLCKVSHPFRADTMIQCGSCRISIHKEHIDDLQKISHSHNYIPFCRPSFSDSIISNDRGEYDHHFWSPIPSLTRSCTICKRKGLPRTQTIRRESHISEDNAARVQIRQDLNSKFIKPCRGLICLWCSEECHRQCWQNVNANNDDNKCDYGKYKNIIVRPQWLHRVVNSPVGFQARFPDNIDASNSSLTPLIVFINKLSGGQKGKIIYNKLIRLLNPRQVFLLENDTTVMQALDIYSSLRNTRILLCGGDGTVGWILSILAKRFSSLDNPPVGICPMGTGNDLSRVLGWDWSYNKKRLLTTLLHISNAKPIALDCWQVDFEPLTRIDSIEESGIIRRCLSRILEHPKFVREIDRPSYQNYQKPLNNLFTNYISLGLDAAVVLDFHDKRMRDSSKFTSPMKNKLIYLNCARHYFREFALWRAWNLRSYMRIICDGQDMTNSLRHCHTVVLLNIPSYGSGTHPWSRTYQHSTSISNNIQHQTEKFNQINVNTFQNIDPPDYSYNQCKFAREDISNTVESSRASATNNQIGRQSIDDHKIEVVGLDSIQMALIHIGFRGRRIAQCSQVRIEIIRSMPVHMDGDPFYLPQSTAINVTHAGQVLVLRNDHK